MLRGAIDLTHPERIGGWIYSELGSVRGRTILAFIDDKCVGSGIVDVFRKDLADAGLGDGYLGFSFPVSVKDPDDICRAIVRLDGSDTVLLQPSSKIASKKKADLFTSIIDSADSIEWMRSSGWLAPEEFTFLKYIHQIGAFDYSLLVPKSADKKETGLLDPVKAAQSLLSLLCLRKTVVLDLQITISEPDSFLNQILAAAKKPLPVVAVTSRVPGTIAVVEGSHFDAKTSSSLVGAVDYPFGPDRLLFLNLACTFKIELEPSETSLRVLGAE
jgi:hypothetical protein